MGMTEKQRQTIAVVPLSKDPVVMFAAEELTSYLRRMVPASQFDCVDDLAGAGSETGGRLRLGLYGELGLPLPKVDDPELDDAYCIDVTDGSGLIAGSNSRSVLLGVYRFLEEAGCRWLRPGDDGDYVPVTPSASIRVQLNEKASYRHRGLCIEGAVSLENMLDNIAWAPKLGFNAYFIEFKTPHTFFDRWYSHRHNPYKETEVVTPEQVDAFTVAMEQEIKRRGLLYHAVGHGWTGEPLGLPCLGWDPVEYEVEPEKSQYFAMVDGERKLWGGVPLNTNLCFSNPEARRLMVQYAADHAERNPQIDLLHVWLADAFNNHCECGECVKALPSDFYFRLLNEMDEEFTARGLPTRIVFLLYLDLLWVPETETLRNKERFMLLFAPISRTYSSSYDADTSDITHAPYVRNRLKFPTNIRENVAFLQEWQQLFDGDGFTYEYHHMWDHYNDPGYFLMADMISQDVKNLRKLRLNGIISDQTQRSFLPTGLGMYVLGKTLWNEHAEFRALAEDYFQGAFGVDGRLCMQYMEQLSILFDPPYMRGEKPRVSREAAEKLSQVPEVVAGFRSVIERNAAAAHDPSLAKSWEYVGIHADIVLLLADALRLRAEGKADEARSGWALVADYVQRCEDQVQPVFDVFLFIQTLAKYFNDETKTHFGGDVT
jgi:hypothetical protein